MNKNEIIAKATSAKAKQTLKYVAAFGSGAVINGALVGAWVVKKQNNKLAEYKQFTEKLIEISEFSKQMMSNMLGYIEAQQSIEDGEKTDGD